MLRLLHTDGREFERADPIDLAAAPWPGADGTFAARVSDMATRARRLARGEERATRPPLSAISSPPRQPSARPREPIFGAIDSFVRPVPPAPAMLTRISAHTVQPAQQTANSDLKLMTAPPPRPVRPPPRQVERPAHGPHIYKPWR
jgi:hypothetical protein